MWLYPGLCREPEFHGRTLCHDLVPRFDVLIILEITAVKDTQVLCTQLIDFIA